MHELNISSFSKLARFSESIRAKFKSTKFRYFCIRHQKPSSTWRKNIFSYIRTHTPLFGPDFGIYVAQKQGTFEDQELIIIEVKIYLH